MNDDEIIEKVTGCSKEELDRGVYVPSSTLATAIALARASEHTKTKKEIINYLWTFAKDEEKIIKPLAYPVEFLIDKIEKKFDSSEINKVIK